MAMKGFIEQKDDVAWKAAKEYVTLLSPQLPVFSTCIRLLRSSASPSSTELTDSGEAVALRLLECPGIKIPFYFAALRRFRLELEKALFVPELMLLKCFSREEFAAMLSLLVLVRRAKRLAPPMEFERLTRALQLSVDLGMHVGSSIPEIGVPTGLLMGGLRELAVSAFLVADENSFRAYWTEQGTGNLCFDLQREKEIWGCTHAHVGTLLLLLLGFGVDYSYSFYLGITARNPKAFGWDALRVRVLLDWLAALSRTGKAPETDLGDEFLLTHGQFEDLFERISLLLRQGSPCVWLTKTIHDVDAALQIKLFGCPKEDTHEYRDLPERLKQSVSVDEWSRLGRDIEQVLEAK